MPLTRIKSLGITDGTIVNADISASAAIAGTKLSGAGKVLQVITATKVDTQTITGVGDDSPEDFISIGLSASITPSSASSTILIIANINTSANNTSYGSIFRGTSATTLGNTISNTNLSQPTSSGNRNKCFAGDYGLGSTSQTITMPMIFVDSPSTTSARVYEIGLTSWSTGVLYINRSETDTDTGQLGRAVSTLTLMEIGA